MKKDAEKTATLTICFIVGVAIIGRGIYEVCSPNPDVSTLIGCILVGQIIAIGGIWVVNG